MSPEIKKTFSLEDVFSSLEDQREKRIDKILDRILKTKRIHQMTNIKPDEMVFYLQFNAFGEIMEFFYKNGFKNPKGNIKHPPIELPNDIKNFMLGLSRSRKGWFIDNIFRYLRAEDYEKENIGESKRVQSPEG